VAGQADAAADQAGAVADQVQGDVHALLLALGGGPPTALRTTDVRATSAITALSEAAAALRDGASALRTFAARLT
jgi:hypothetical protein